MVAHVSAWNYPYFVGLNSIVPALLVGNAVCYKPSEHATLTGLRLVDLMHRAGVPVDVVHAIVGAGATGAALVDADVDMVCFTGSYATGQRSRAPRPTGSIRVQLELGGKDAAYVCDDVDIDEAALAIAEGAFYNGGQSCSATERVYVHEAIADAFVAALVDVVAAYRVGDPTDDATDVGPLARSSSMSSKRRSPTRCSAAPRCCAAAIASNGPETGSRPPSWSTFPTTPRSCATRASAR